MRSKGTWGKVPLFLWCYKNMVQCSIYSITDIVFKMLIKWILKVGRFNPKLSSFVCVSNKTESIMFKNCLMRVDKYSG